MVGPSARVKRIAYYGCAIFLAGGVVWNWVILSDRSPEMPQWFAAYIALTMGVGMVASAIFVFLARKV